MLRRDFLVSLFFVSVIMSRLGYTTSSSFVTSTPCEVAEADKLQSSFKIKPHSTSQIIHFAPSTETECGFRAVILRDVVNKKGEFKLIEPFAVDRKVIENCLGKKCFTSEPLVFVQSCSPGSVLEEYNSSQPRFVMSATAYLEWLRYMSNDRVKVYNNMLSYMKKIRGPDVVNLDHSVHNYGPADIETSQELDVSTDCIIKVCYNWNFKDPNPKMHFTMQGVLSHYQHPFEIPVDAFNYLQAGVKRIREELGEYKKDKRSKKSCQSVNGK